jgi:hypothetical protein
MSAVLAYLLLLLGGQPHDPVAHPLSGGDGPAPVVSQ